MIESRCDFNDAENRNEDGVKNNWKFSDDFENDRHVQLVVVVLEIKTKYAGTDLLSRPVLDIVARQKYRGPLFHGPR